MPAPSVVDRRRSPTALVIVGIPAYLLLVGFSVRALFDELPRGRAVAALVVIAVFSVIFVWLAVVAHDLSAQSLTTAIVALTVLAIVIALLGSTSAIYLVAAGAMAGDGLRPRHAIAVIAIASVALGIMAVANDFDVVATLTAMFVPVMVGLFTSGMQRLLQANLELEAAREEVARLAVVDERLRFARDLHDVLGHSLTVIRAKSELAARLARRDADAAAREMVDIERIARASLAEVRETVTGYRRRLGQELQDARGVLRDAGLDVSVTEPDTALRPDVDDVLAWVVRESVTNVIRHSGASMCRIETSSDDGTIRLVVTDNGRGAENGSAGGNGLLGARERLALVGGTLEAGATPTGFRVVATVPASS